MIDIVTTLIQLSLDAATDGLDTGVTAMENDNKVQILKFNISDASGNPIDYTQVQSAVMMVKVGSNTYLEPVPCTVNADSLEITLQNELLKYNGAAQCAIRIYSSDEQIFTTNYFFYMIVNDIYDDTDVITGDRTNLVNLLLKNAIDGKLGSTFALPAGGTTGQILTKVSNVDNTLQWSDQGAASLPAGGTTGQVLAKIDNTDGNAHWVDGNNNISDANALDLTDSGDSTLHFHSADRDRTNHTGTQSADTITDGVTKKVYTTTEQNKLSGIEDGAQVNPTNAEIKTAYEANADTNAFTDAEQTKLSGVESGAEVNNISDVNATDLTDGGDSTLHFHSTDRNRANHTGTQLASTISDFDTEVSNNASVVANTAKVSYPSGDQTKVSNLTVTAPTNLDTMRSDVSTNNAKISYPVGDSTKVGNITVTQPVDLDDMEAKANDSFQKSTDNTDNIIESATKVFVTPAEKAQITTNQNEIDNLKTYGNIVDVTTSRVLALSDANKFLKITSSTDINITVETNVTTAFEVGTQIDIFIQGTGAVTIVSSGVTLQSKNGNLKSNGQYVGISLKYLGSDTWAVFGDLTV